MGANLESFTCVTCGVEFGMTPEYLASRRASSSRKFYCPNSHVMCFPDLDPKELLLEVKVRALVKELDEAKKTIARQAKEIEELEIWKPATAEEST